MEDCFQGGVTTGGMDNIGVGYNNVCNIKWEANYTLRAAYALTYRYGRPAPHAMRINGNDVLWNMQNQAGPEQIETNGASDFFAPHVKDITNIVQFTDDTLRVDFPEQQFYDIEGWNWGWWGIYVVVLYESPDITTNVCSRIYIANESQVTPQSYSFQTPNNIPDSPVLLAIHSSRLSPYESEDASVIQINGNDIGHIFGPDSVTPLPYAGVQGHFYYENEVATGLNGDVANNQVAGQDGIAVINNYLNWSSPDQNLELYRETPAPFGGANPHPAFLIIYTPSCPVSATTMPRAYTSCRSQSTPRGQPDNPAATQFQALPGYDHYDWTPGVNFNDSTIANPFCTADSSGWYRVRMWSDDPDGLCDQTIPVFYTVGQVPRPGKLKLTASTCPANTGKIVFTEMKGNEPFQYTVNETTQSSATFQNLEPGTYSVSVTDGLGCTWDSTIVIPLNPLQEAAFTANPEAGYSPLQVALSNQSTNATSYLWLIDGEPFSSSENTSYTFPDSGLFQIALVAYRIDPSCADTAYVTIRVAQGLEVIVPNIITPNSDGMNDELVAKIAGVESMHWEVFNRWGNSLFSGDALKPNSSLTLWSPEEGEYPSGVYSVVLTLKGMSGEVRKMVVQVMVK